MPTPPNPPTQTTHPPRMAPKVGSSPSRPGFTAPKPAPGPHVESEHLDPQAMMEQSRRPMRPAAPEGSPAKSPEQALMENMEPLDFARIAASRPPPPKKEETPMEPPEPMKESLEVTVTGDLISKLEAKFGIQPEKTHDVTLRVLGQDLNVTFRLPNYDDYIWSMAVIERKLLSQEDISLLQTDAQRNNLMTHLVACRAILKIEGEWLWDVFKRVDEIKAVNPSWNGTGMTGVPDFVQGTMASAVYDLFRKRLHADLLFELEKAVKEADDALRQKAGAEKNEDPSSAA